MTSDNRKTGRVTLRVTGKDSKDGISVGLTGAIVHVFLEGGTAAIERKVTDSAGTVTVDLPAGTYIARVGREVEAPQKAAGRGRGAIDVAMFDVHPGCDFVKDLEIAVAVALELDVDGKGEFAPYRADMTLPSGRAVMLRMTATRPDAAEPYFEKDHKLQLSLVAGKAEVRSLPSSTSDRRQFLVTPHGAEDVTLHPFFGVTSGKIGGMPDLGLTLPVVPPAPSPIEGSISVGLRRTASRFTDDVPLWVAIRKSTEALSFDRYFDFMNWLFCNDPSTNPLKSRSDVFKRSDRRALPFTDTDAYRNVKAATEAFVMANCGVFHDFNSHDARYVADQVAVPTTVVTLDHAVNEYLQPIGPTSEPRVLQYLAIIREKLIDQRLKDTDIGDVMLQMNREAVDACYGVLRQKLTCPCLFELIWSYWQEEGMLVQTVNAIARRFQNIRSPLGNDPLANLEIDPLRPLNNVIWGYVQDEQHRLSVVRRNYEYDHHYGLRLAGRAVQEVRTADSRSKFLEAFHTLLSITAAFYKRDDDTTIVADGFPVLNALKEAHLILSQGAHNQFGDLPSTARIEMLMQQWILARPEFREFLPTRIMVAYPEPWMDRVDAMKKLQNWTDTSVLHFRNLAIFGEQVLLGIRYGAWAGVIDPAQATNWARYWRPEIQGYMHAYRSVTGIDLTVDVTNARIDATMPSVHLVQRLTEQQRRA